jgi:GNAT superfamily N-acetyltransferase
MSLDVRALTGVALEAALEDVAALRITVFRDWPYLYDGDLDYERRYLSIYGQKEDAILVGAFDGARLVGAATGTPLEDHAADFAAPFAGTAFALEDVFYCAESVLLPEYRGQGAGNAFFDVREAKARSLARKYVAFCGVIRPDDHPLRPAQARSLEPFWRGRGYAPLPRVVAKFAWKDVDASSETQKPLQFWIKSL